MTERLSAVAGAVDLLDRLASERAAPSQAHEHLARLREQHRGLRVDLVWATESFDRAVHYDVVIREPDGRTVSVAVTPAGDGLPWPLRGAQRVGDRVLLEVDGERLEIGEAVQLLDTMDGEPAAGVAERLVTLCLVRAELARRVAAMSAQEVDEAVRAHRARLRLQDDGDVAVWCRARGMDPPSFRHVAARCAALTAARRDGVEGRGFEQWLAARRASAQIRWFWSLGGASEAALPA